MDKDLIWAIVLISLLMIAIVLSDIKTYRNNLHNQIDKKQFYLHDWNCWFEENIQNISHDRYCLSCLEEDSRLEKKFWTTIRNLNLHIEKDKKFQRLIIDYNDKWYVFKKLVYSYALHYDFLPELVEIMNTNERFQSAKETYEKGKADRKS